MQDLFLGIDLGTTAIKFAVIGADNYVYQTSVAVTTFNGPNGARYQSAAEILRLITETLLQIPSELRTKINKVAFSTAMHSLWPVDPDNSTNDQIFIWSDQQAAGVVSDFKQTELAKSFYLKTGTPIHPMSPFAKIKYFKSQAVEQYPAQTKWLGLKELLLDFFTGKIVLDYSTASATGLLNLSELDWDAEILQHLGIGEENLAQLVDCRTPLAIKETVATAFGLDPKTQVYPGASDGCLAAYAGFVNSGNRDSLTIGTSAAVRRINEEIKLDPIKQNFCYYLGPINYVVGAPSNNGGIVFEWAKKMSRSNNFYNELVQVLNDTSVGANGVKFWPFLNGERAPYWDATKRAEFKYISTETTKSEMLRAIFEGMLLNVRSLAELVGVSKTVTASGGFFKTQELAQLTADILGVDLAISDSNEPLAGLYSLITGGKVLNNKNDAPVHISFNSNNNQQYNKLYPHYFE